MLRCLKVGVWGRSCEQGEGKNQSETFTDCFTTRQAYIIHPSSQQLCKIGTIIISTLQMGKWTQSRLVTCPGHTADKWQSCSSFDCCALFIFACLGEVVLQGSKTARLGGWRGLGRKGPAKHSLNYILVIGIQVTAADPLDPKPILVPVAPAAVVPQLQLIHQPFGMAVSGHLCVLVVSQGSPQALL